MVGGTGQKLHAVTTIVAGVAALAATVVSIVSIWFQTKNYRKPLLQRYVVRILLMVPIYSITSWASMVSMTAAFILDPIRDIYEAFTIYTFLQLMVNYLGGERAIIIMTHGRSPVRHMWPLQHLLPPVDISDPYTFLAIKRGILQYTWLKPILSLATIIMKATGVYQEGYIGVDSGYFWIGIVYNLSVTVSLYSLGLFWVCMHQDLKPFRPVPKFLCVKLIIFASYWQGFFLSILVWLGAIPDDVQGYSPDNLAAAIQDALICMEMPIFAAAHWYAFSWHDFAVQSVSSARMPVLYAIRDALGPKDLIEDSKETFSGDKYAYRAFDSGDKIMAHEDSKSRLARLNEGMRYERGGKGKYWIPKPGEASATTPLLGSNGGGPSRIEQAVGYGNGTPEPNLNDDDEDLYEQARKLEFGDWNYPVITVNEPSRERWITTSSRSYGERYNSSGSISSTSTSRQKQKQKQKAVPTPETVVPKKKRKQKQKEVVPPVAPPDQQTDGIGENSAQGPSDSSERAVRAEPSRQMWYDGAHEEDVEDEGPGWGGSQAPTTDSAPRVGLGGQDDSQNVWGGSEITRQ